MAFLAPPPTAAWRRQGSRSGFEVAYFTLVDDGLAVEGVASAIEGGQTWAIDYKLVLDATWTTRRAGISGRSALGLRTVALEADGAGHWLVDGEIAPHLDGCLDVDLEGSAMTNALAVHRAGLPIGGQAVVPAAYVRAPDLAVEPLEQIYIRVSDTQSHQRYDYSAPALGFGCRLLYDASGLVLDYPGIATRAG
ncbi:MAG: putative glycolipid-binding domain-containing protein [Actinomycetota bacterium]